MKRVTTATPLAFALILLLAPGLAWAQSLLDAAIPPTPSDGIQLPFSSAALQDDATSLEVNPAGLGFMDTTEFGYGFQTPRDDLNEVADRAHSFFLAGGNQYVGAGFAAQFLEQPRGGLMLDEYRKYTLGFALASPRAFSIGFNYNWFGSDRSERLDDLASWDIGWQLRLGEYIGFGFMARDINAPFVADGVSLARRYSGAMSFRLFEGRLILDNSFEWFEDSELTAWTPRLLIEPINGLKLFGNATFAIDRRSNQEAFEWDALWAGVEISLRGMGAAYAPVFDRTASEDPSYTSMSAYHWVSPNKQRGLFDFGGRWVKIDLNKATTESALTFSFFSPQARSFLELVKTLEDISNDETVDGVVLVGGSTDFGYGQTWELRRAIHKLRTNGKKTVAYISSARIREYFLATAAEQVWLYPTEPFNPGGVQARFVSYRGVLRKVGIEAEFVKIGRYKSAPEALVNAEQSEPAREQLTSIVDSLYETATSAIAEDRGKSQEAVAKAIENAPLFPHEALENDWVDAVVYPDELSDTLRDRFGSLVLEESYENPIPREERWGTPGEIAVVTIEGNIITGNSGVLPFSNSIVTGGETIRQVCDALAKDGNVVGVVIRVDSPGGSAFASDQMYRAIRRLAAKKPVVASMGNVAASGGYYAAAGADEIYASPTTITGSIGIFNGKFNAGGLLDWLNVRSATIERGPQDTGIYRPWTQDELRRIREEVEYRYKLFLYQIAQTRPLTIDELDKVARGRVWMGDDALEQKLVDELGGLWAAIRRVEELAGVERGESVYRLYPSGAQFFGVGAGALSSIGDWFGLNPAQDVVHLQRETLLKKLVGSLEKTALLPILYRSEEPLMLPYEAIEID